MILLITGWLSAVSWSADIKGRVVSVHDRGMLILLTSEQQQIKIRMAEK
ncbi:hypothetical protein [Candidatus Williamhamiltonella defendens]|nr:hypothetical protein [Candidatus Hamiltonella defensa]